MQPNAARQYEFVKFLDISVAYQSWLDGGGRHFGQEFIEVVSGRLGFRKHVFELCAGPGFIGFSLLAHRLCKNLTLADINAEAVAACKTTIDLNNLRHCCSTHVSDVLDDIPETESWDLIVGNPPHWPACETENPSLLKHDVGLRLHERFFLQARRYLKTGGSVLLQENARATTPEDFESMIDRGGFQLLEVIKANAASNFYFLLCQ